MSKQEFILKNLACANCANKIQTKLERYKDLKNVNLNFSKLRLTYETEEVSKEEIEKIVKQIEPGVELLEKNSKIEDNNKTLFQVCRLITGVATATIGFILNASIVIKTIFIFLGYAILLYRTIKNAIKLLVKTKTINENFLVTVSCIGAYLVGEHMEGLMVITLYEIGKILEEKAINKTRKSISDLMNIKPEYANIKIGNEIKKVTPEEVKIGDIVIVKKGEKTPLDGIVIKGRASLDVASLTGESKLKNVKENDEILSGSIVIDGLLEVKVISEYENSTVNKILALVENATDKKAKTETFVNKAAKIYTPIVFILAILTAILLPLITKVSYTGKEGSIYRALIFLVISCPCAIAISVPLSYFSGIGRASKIGVLIKGSDYLDILKDVKEMVFDKTGTLTKGEFYIQEIEVYNKEITKEKLLEYVVMGESFSNHPIAKSILKNANMQVDTSKVKDYKEISGMGISYTIDEKEILIGNKNLVEGLDNKEEFTSIYVKIDNELVGALLLMDKPKEDAKVTIDNLKKMRIRTQMFTGDDELIADKIGKELEIDQVKANMLPTDKYAELEKVINKYKGTNNKVAFVGDGINDSPVLALADIGISMGGVGAESAIEASDIVIMTDSLNKIYEGIKISKKTGKIIKQNLVFAIGTKVLILLLSTLGIAGMWEAVFADVGVTVLTILNVLRK